MRGLATVLAVVVAATSHGQTPRFREGIEVVASRLDQAVERRVIVLTRQDIARLPVRSLADLVAWVAGAGVARRAAFGIQADAGLRGATFEQVAVLVNGVRVNDPQTGHFHLDLPYPLEAVARVEVLLGPGSAVHGPDAFGGVVEITVEAPAEATARVGVGHHALRDAAAVLPVGGGAWVAVSRTSSHGFRPDTEFGISRGVVGWRGGAGRFDLRLDAAVDAKDFGAWAFYSQRFPDERERTGTAVTTLTASRELGWARLEVRAGGRQHRDVFILDRRRPDWYRNRHRTRSGSLQAALTGRLGSASWSAGGELQREAVSSSRLGEHDQGRTALFAESAWQRGGWGVALQARADRLESRWEFSPALGVSRELGGGLSLAYHGGRSFRVPSFTDRYYVSPDTLGNPDLVAETAWSDELSLRMAGDRWRVEAALFRRRANHLIDYLRDDDGIYRATNHAASTTVGSELAASLKGVGPFVMVRVAAAKLESDLRVDPLRSRYGLSHPRFELSTNATARLPNAVTLDLAWRYRAPQRGGGFTLADVRMTRPVGRGIELALEATNVLDRTFEEVPGVPMPGRWVSVSAVWNAGGAGGGGWLLSAAGRAGPSSPHPPR